MRLFAGNELLFAPLVPWLWLGVLAVLCLLVLALAFWRGARVGWVWRAGAVLGALAMLSGPVLRHEDRQYLPDIVLVVSDQSASQRLADRAAQSEEAEAQLAAQIKARFPEAEMRRVVVGDGEGDEGTRLMAALGDALGKLPRARLAGVVIISDGQNHDSAHLPADIGAPVHLLLTGREKDWDRRLVVRNAPAFAILGQEVVLTVRVDHDGLVPDHVAQQPVALSVSVNGEREQSFRITPGRDIPVPVVLNRGGRNVLHFTLPEVAGEITGRNNGALVQINGIRDRLRVLLVSGAPHAGGRTWRNLLKSDSAVDLVHFTILRTQEKQNFVPVEELSLIAFPVRELFMEKVTDFDLIILDRFRQRSTLPWLYLQNLKDYVLAGGAVLLVAGDEFAGAESLAHTPLGQLLPARPTARLFTERFTPEVTEMGERHPVTQGLEGAENWGPWLRMSEVMPVRERKPQVVMEGAQGAPLLTLARQENGRVALLSSDQPWLWDRGFEGGGPQLELLRRLAHWLMKEPELEEEALWAEPEADGLRIFRRSLSAESRDVVVEPPEGEARTLPLTAVSPGLSQARLATTAQGLYRLTSGGVSAVVGLGPAQPREFENTLASAAPLEPLLAATGGSVIRLETGHPQLRAVSQGRATAGRGWIGFTPRKAYTSRNLRQTPLLPPWVALLWVAGMLITAWLREGRR